MIPNISLRGKWSLALDEKCELSAPPDSFPRYMMLPGTTAQQMIGTQNTRFEEGCLTEKYPFEGQIWLFRTVMLMPDQVGKPCTLFLERTRMTRLWVNGCEIGSESSLCTPHEYDLTGHTAETMHIVLCIRNTDYPTRGGHMTSPDTQTNWIGITGQMLLKFHEKTYLSDIRTFPSVKNHSVAVKGILHGASAADIRISASLCLYPGTDGISYPVPETVPVHADSDGSFEFTVPLPQNVPLWNAHQPAIIELKLSLANGECTSMYIGMREFTANGNHFEINGVPVMLRGKHDALVFPQTGYAPTDIDAWMHIMQIYKNWGINHVRFHTCCPPAAAFEAPDVHGNFLEPELPFWGTIDAEGGEQYHAKEQAYLIREGLRICKAYGNHPSFCMFSLGNELCGSPERLGEIIRTLREADPRPLYTSGSNNFQHFPLQIPEEDFWTGVRTGKGMLLRGSYAMCDAPLGKIQTHAPSANWNYTDFLTVPNPAAAKSAQTPDDLLIQKGTEIEHVHAVSQTDAFVPSVPVITHEIGQYACYPDYDEIAKYIGVLMPHNLERYRSRLQAAGMGNMEKRFYRCAGSLSRDCYKMEIEAAMRTPELAGFQLLDLQDYPGQGSAPVGMLNVFLENKGFIQPEQWRNFCGDLVPLAMFDSYVLRAGHRFRVRYAVRNFRQKLTAQSYVVLLTCGRQVIARSTGVIPSPSPGFLPLGGANFSLRADLMGEAELTFEIPGARVKNTWQLGIIPPPKEVSEAGVYVAHSFADAKPYLDRGEDVLLLPYTVKNAVTGQYCTDFWNYRMFRQISESMGKPEPVGTLGLCIQADHPIAKAMFSKEYATPQWYTPVTHADCAVLDFAPEGYCPIVQMIDNVERCHRLGLIFEAKVGNGRLLVCTVRLHEAPDDPSVNRLHHALIDYIRSHEFMPAARLDENKLAEMF